MSAFIDEYRNSYGVEPICRTLQFAPSTYYAVKARQKDPADRTLSDRKLLVEIRRAHADSDGLYGARKVWHELLREEVPVARCTVERLMAREGLQGVVRGGNAPKTTQASQDSDRAEVLVDRDFKADRPNRLWVADFTYVATWSGFAYSAFLLDCFSRRIVGWRVARSMKTELVLDAIEMALWIRDREGDAPGPGLIHH